MKIPKKINKVLIHKRKSSKLSTGEKIVTEYLRKAHIKFIREHHHPDLINDKTGNNLFFDFFLPRLNVVIEVDGRHHYEAINGDEARLRDQQYRDDIKDIFCQERGIKMLRITYSDLRPPLTKLTECLGASIDVSRHIHKKHLKRAKGEIKPKKIKKQKKQRVVLSPRQVQNKKKLNIGNRVKEKNMAWEAEIERKRQEARKNYPAHLRLKFEKNVSSQKITG